MQNKPQELKTVAGHQQKQNQSPWQRGCQHKQTNHPDNAPHGIMPSMLLGPEKTIRNLAWGKSGEKK